MIPEEEDGHLGNIQVLLAVKRKEKIKFKIVTKNGEKKWKGKEYMMKNYPNQMVTYYEIKIFENG